MKLTTNFGGLFSTKGRTHEALLRLAEDHEDAAALIAVFRENREPIETAVRHWLGDKNKYDEATKDVLLTIGQRARHFDPQADDASDFVRECAYLECRRRRLEIEADSGAYN